MNIGFIWVKGGVRGDSFNVGINI